jgi:ABC-type polar amino acid transport system ATPase subunit
MLTCTAIHKSFNDGTLKILNGVDCTIKPGEITCLIGPSGSGKTTLLRALGLLENPDVGAVSIDDQTYHFPLQNGTKVTPPWPFVTVVFQSLFLWPHMTLYENIALPARNLIADDHILNDQIMHLAEKFDMTGFIHRYPNEASLGQRQRVALARALILRPKYVLLDEITSALDVEQIERILEYLLHLKSQGVGVFLITHLIGFARRAANQVLFMNQGKIEEQGGPEIIRTPQSSRLQQFLKTIEAAS